MARNTGRGSRAVATDPGGFPWIRLHGGQVPAGCWRAHRAGRPCRHEPQMCPHCGLAFPDGSSRFARWYRQAMKAWIDEHGSTRSDRYLAADCPMHQRRTGVTPIDPQDLTADEQQALAAGLDQLIDPDAPGGRQTLT